MEYVKELQISNGSVLYDSDCWEVCVNENMLYDDNYEYVNVYTESNNYTLKAIEKFINAGVTTNIHYVLSTSSIDEAINRLQNNSFPKGVNAVIFLLHKPVGLGCQDEVLKIDNPKLKTFFDLVDNWQGNLKIGFDSCSIPGILNFTENISLQSLDTCEGARFSAYITADMIMTPCSFDQSLKYGVNLKENSIQAAWNSSQFQSFRDKLTRSCPDCFLKKQCMGGCPLTPEIVLCGVKQ